MPAPVVDNVLALIGRTPLIRLRRVVPEGAATVWGKAEYLNPGGSVKDRICLAMLDQAEAEGRLEAGATVVEPTSGNTGVGLALVSAVRGYRLTLTMPASMSLERRQLLQAYGAEVVLTEPERVMEGAIAEARRRVDTEGAFMPQQFDNPANPTAHAEGTAQEILDAFEADGAPGPDAFVAAVGTGGTISGVGRVLKARRPDARLVAVEPAASPVLAGGAPGPTKIQGIGAGFVPRNYDPVVDQPLQVDDRDAWEMKNRLAREEGILVGISAGANVAAAIRVATELGAGHDVVTILCDTGERYFSLDEYFS